MYVVPKSPPVRHPLCRHCQRKPPNRPLGLCWSCYYLPGVRELYPSESKFSTHERGKGEKGEDIDHVERPVPAEPTEALPGTREKSDVLVRRAGQGEALWHPGDAKRGEE